MIILSVQGNSFLSHTIAPAAFSVLLLAISALACKYLYRADPSPQAAVLNGRVLILMRGLPGSGKSTLAKTLQIAIPKAVIVSTDDRFMKDGVYTFDASKLGKAHDETVQIALDHFREGTPVIVDNCNTERWHMERYSKPAQELNYKVHYVESHTFWAKCPVLCWFKTTHSVPYSQILAMSRKWERI